MNEQRRDVLLSILLTVIFTPLLDSTGELDYCNAPDNQLMLTLVAQVCRVGHTRATLIKDAELNNSRHAKRTCKHPNGAGSLDLPGLVYTDAQTDI